jgi:hypothetical protein
MVRAVAGTGAAQTAVTGNTNENTTVSFVVPAGSIGPNGELRISGMLTLTNNANNKTIRVKYGATTLWTASPTSAASFRFDIVLANRNSQSSQVNSFSSSTSYGNSANAVGTSSIDFSADQTITITLQLATGTDSMTLEQYRAVVVPAA